MWTGDENEHFTVLFQPQRLRAYCVEVYFLPLVLLLLSCLKVDLELLTDVDVSFVFRQSFDRFIQTSNYKKNAKSAKYWVATFNRLSCQAKDGFYCDRLLWQQSRQATCKWIDFLKQNLAFIYSGNVFYLQSWMNNLLLKIHIFVTIPLRVIHTL